MAILDMDHNHRNGKLRYHTWLVPLSFIDCGYKNTEKQAQTRGRGAILASKRNKVISQKSQLIQEMTITERDILQNFTCYFILAIFAGIRYNTEE